MPPWAEAPLLWGLCSHPTKTQRDQLYQRKCFSFFAQCTVGVWNSLLDLLISDVPLLSKVKFIRMLWTNFHEIQEEYLS